MSSLRCSCRCVSTMAARRACACPPRSQASDPLTPHHLPAILCPPSPTQAALPSRSPCGRAHAGGGGGGGQRLPGQPRRHGSRSQRRSGASSGRGGQGGQGVNHTLRVYLSCLQLDAFTRFMRGWAGCAQPSQVEHHLHGCGVGVCGLKAALDGGSAEIKAVRDQRPHIHPVRCQQRQAQRVLRQQQESGYRQAGGVSSSAAGGNSEPAGR